MRRKAAPSIARRVTSGYLVAVALAVAVGAVALVLQFSTLAAIDSFTDRALKALRLIEAMRLSIADAWLEAERYLDDRAPRRLEAFDGLMSGFDSAMREARSLLADAPPAASLEATRLDAETFAATFRSLAEALAARDDEARRGKTLRADLDAALVPLLADRSASPALSEALSRLRDAEYRRALVLAYGNDSERLPYRQSMIAASRALERLGAAARTTIAALEAWNASFERERELVAETVSLANDRLEPRSRRVMESLVALQGIAEADARLEAYWVRTFLVVAIALVTAVTGIAALGGLAVAGRVSSRIAEPLSRVAKAAAGLAGNDLARFSACVRALATGEPPGEFRAESLPVDGEGDDETGTVVRAYNDLVRSFREAGELFSRANAAVVRRTAGLADAKEKAEEAARSKSRFLATASHEIRAPLAAVIGYLGLLETDLAAIVDAEAGSDRNAEMASARLGKALFAARSLSSVVDDVLDWSRIEAGRLSLERVPFDVRDLVGETVDLLAPAARSKGISLVSAVDEDFPRALVGDPLRVSQILRNLAGNAVKFTDTGGVEIRVAAEGRERGILARMSVRDTGIGVPPGRLEAVFAPYEQAESSTSRAYGGSGLGLAISRRLATLMGGVIRAESEVGKGSVFSFEAAFDVADAAPPRGQTTGDRRASGERDGPAGSPVTYGTAGNAAVRTLVVDDEDMNLEIAGEVLRRAGIEADAARSGEEALSLASSNAYAAIFLDLRMPGMDGFETAARLKEALGHACPPLVAMSAADDDETRERSREAGMTHVLPKPVVRGSMLALLGSLGLAAAPRVEEREPLSPRSRRAGDFGATRLMNSVASAARDRPAIDMEALRERLGLERETLLDLGRRFLDDHAGWGAELLASLSGDPARTRRLAHSMRGLAGNVGAFSLSDAAGRLEDALASGNGDPGAFAEAAAAEHARAVAGLGALVRGDRREPAGS